MLLLASPHIEPSRLRQIAWGVLVACITSTVILLWLIANGNPRPLTPGVILTTYSSLRLLLSAIALYSIKWQLTKWRRLENGLKILVTVFTFYGFMAAQTRTGQLGLPVFVLLAVILFVGANKPKKAIALLLVVAVGLIAGVVSNDALRGRIAAGIQEVQACQGENSTQPSSMCIRLQLWHASIDAGLNHPWAGLGQGSKFADYLQNVAVHKGMVGQHVVDLYFGEPHNDLLLALVGFGFPGLVGLLLIYFVPCAYFLPRLLRHDMPPGPRCRCHGPGRVPGFFFFGLAETMFRRMNTIGFYTAMVAWLMVLSEPKAQPKAGALGARKH